MQNNEPECGQENITSSDSTSGAYDIQEKQYRRMTSGPVSKVVLSMGIPAVIGMLVTSIYNGADTYFVGQLGTSASGAVGVVFSLMNIIQAIGFTIGQGASSLISRRLGEQDYEKANRIASTTLLLAVAFGIIILGLGLVFLDPFMRLLGATETMLPHAKAYANYILLAAPFMVISFVMNNLLRAEGKIKFAMIGISIGGILNIGLDPLFIHAFSLGTAGAAIATAISQLISACILVGAYFKKGFTVVQPRPNRIELSGGMLIDIFKTGLPALLRQGLASISSVALNRSAMVYGDAAVAAMSIVNKVFMLIFSAALGIGQGYQPVAGYNYGARKYSRVRAAYKFTLIVSSAVMTAASAIAFIFAPDIVALFLRDDPEVIRIGALALRIQCCAMPTVPFVVTCNMTFQSVGKAAAASFLSACRQGVFFLLFILVLPPLLKLLGVQSAQAAADVCTFLVAIPMCITFFKKMPKTDEPDA